MELPTDFVDNTPLYLTVLNVHGDAGHLQAPLTPALTWEEHPPILWD